MRETYKTIKDYPNYEVSGVGNVRNIVTGCVLRPGRNKNGYQQVNLYLNGKRKSQLIHRLVADAFIPNPENKRTVNHIDGDKTNNRAENLEWVSDSENIKHAFRVGLNKITDKNNFKTNNPKPRQKVRCVETGQIFESQHHAARYFGVDQGWVRKSIHKGYKVHKKYHFELV